jgi:hypothetical protein
VPANEPSKTWSSGDATSHAQDDDLSTAKRDM